MTRNKENTHPLIRYIKNWEAYNIEEKRLDRFQLISSVAGIVCITLLIGLIFSW